MTCLCIGLQNKRLSFFHNGKPLAGRDISSIKGEVWPIVTVAGGATLGLNFGVHSDWPIPTPSPLSHAGDTDTDHAVGPRRRNLRIHHRVDSTV